MKMIIRKATPADAEGACIVLRRSITECCAEDHRNEPETLSVWLQNKTPENVAAWFAAHDNFSVVATSGEQIVGVALLTAKKELALCYVLPEVLYKGAGKSLLNAMESHAMQLGCTEICLSSTATAKAFYLRNGFTSSGEPEIGFGIQAFPLSKKLGVNNGFRGGAVAPKSEHWESQTHAYKKSLAGISHHFHRESKLMMGIFLLVLLLGILAAIFAPKIMRHLG